MLGVRDYGMHVPYVESCICWITQSARCSIISWGKLLEEDACQLFFNTNAVHRDQVLSSTFHYNYAHSMQFSTGNWSDACYLQQIRCHRCGSRVQANLTFRHKVHGNVPIPTTRYRNDESPCFRLLSAGAQPTPHLLWRLSNCQWKLQSLSCLPRHLRPLPG